MILILIFQANIYPNYLAKTVYRGLSINGFVVTDYAARDEKVNIIHFISI